MSSENQNPFLAYWHDVDHTDKAHQSAIAKAKSSDTSPVPGSVDKVNFRCYFPAGKDGTVYTTTLYECNGPLRQCGSATHPCKHIYRLAMECGLFSENYQSGVNKNIQLSRDEAIARIEQLPEDLQRTVKNFLYYDLFSGHELFTVEALEEFLPLFSCDLLQAATTTGTSLYTCYGRKRDVFPLLDAKNVDAPREASKKKLFQWCADNLSDCFFTFCFVPSFQKAKRSTYNYFHQKFQEDDELIVYLDT